MMSLLKKLFSTLIVLFVVVALPAQTKELPGNQETYPSKESLSSTGYGPVYTNVLYGKDSTLKKGAELVTIDENFKAYREHIIETFKINNLITFSIDEQSPFLIKSDFDATVYLDITIKKANNETENFKKELTVNYRTKSSYQSINYYPFEGAVEVTVKVENITTTAEWDITKLLKLKNDIQARRNMAFDCKIDQDFKIEIVQPKTSQFDEVTVNCILGNTANSFPNEYDIEWAWIDNSAYQAPANNEEIFENNATRVTTTSPTYNIPLLYDGQGFLFVRYRCAQQLVSGQRLEGEWVYNDNNNNALAQFPFDGHENNLNWQATTTYAEDGKRKSVIQYYDGSLRGRQTVTKDNVTQNTIVAETFYDFQGRPVIQVLPAPTLNSIIQFTAKFNEFNYSDNGVVYTGKEAYDMVYGGASSCSQQPATLLSKSGASLYYSGDYLLKIKNKAKDFDNFIPDAANLPYTETKYTNDGTGRIDAKGGVGPVHQINGGHDTKYLYESPTQSELDALFGTDVGYASHYFKNWVRDANGQYSVSYVDMHGRTIATSLAGQSPENLKALPSEAKGKLKITDELLDNKTNGVVGKSIISSKSLVVPKAGDYTFNYSFTAPTLKLPNCEKENFEYECKYDIKISIIDDCGGSLKNIIVDQNSLSGFSLDNYYLNYDPKTPILFTINLPEGSYTIVKELRLNQQSYMTARANFLKNNVCMSITDFENEQKKLSLIQSNCSPTCSTCSTKLGTRETFVTKFIVESKLNEDSVRNDTSMMAQLMQAYVKDSSNCAKLCNTENSDGFDEIRSIEKIMLSDVSPPYGQYAKPAEVQRSYNIFNSLAFNVLPFRNPLNNQSPFTPSNYKNQSGVDEPKQPRTNGTVQDFIDDFKDSYADQLIAYHPEYCKLLTTKQKLKPAYQFEYTLSQTNTWKDAVKNGYINNIVNDITSLDPYFNLAIKDPTINAVTKSFLASQKADMADKMYSHYQKQTDDNGNITFFGMWEIAQMSVLCRNQFGALQKDPSNNTLQLNATNCLAGCQKNGYDMTTSDKCAADLDIIWTNFKSFYISYRKSLIAQFLNEPSNLVCANPTGRALNNSEIIDLKNKYVRVNNNAQRTFDDYTPRFIEFPAAPNASGSYPTTGNTAYDNAINHATTVSGNQALSNQSSTICSNNAQNWMNALKQCNAIKTIADNDPAKWEKDSISLVDALVKICSAGVSFMDHPFGASSLPNGTSVKVDDPFDPNGIKKVANFPDIISSYLSSLGVPVSAQCNPYSITFPPPYQNSTPIIEVPVITKPSDCDCDRIKLIKSQWMATGPVGSFKDYLLTQHGTTISASDLTTLDNLCSGTYNCNFIPNPITIPPALQCKGSDPSTSTCIDCDRYTQYVNEFRNKYVTIANAKYPLINAPYPVPDDADQLQANQFFAQFMNYHTGFNKTWYEYIDFGTKCEKGMDAFSCGALQSALDNYYKSSSYLNNTSGTACRDNFTEYMNKVFAVYFSFDQWENLFIKNNCTPLPNICNTPEITCQQFNSYLLDFYNTNTLLIYKNANCSQIFTNFMDSRLGNQAAYADLDNWYKSNCGGCSLNICSFPNATVLTIAYNNFVQQYGHTLRNAPNCSALFTKYFNNLFQLNNEDGSPGWNWNTIVKTYYEYNRCVPNIDALCTPPYNCESLNAFWNNTNNQVQIKDIFSHIDCQQRFVEFFNKNMDASYTSFADLKQLFLICNIKLPSCNPEFSCAQLHYIYNTFLSSNYYSNHDQNCVDQFVIYFNLYFGTKLSYDEIKKLYSAAHCDLLIEDICKNINPTTLTCKDISSCIDQFKELEHSKDTNFQTNINCQDNFVAFFNAYINKTIGIQGYFNIAAIEQILQALGNECVTAIPCTPIRPVNPNEYPSSIERLIYTYVSSYNNLKLPLNARRQLFTSLYNQGIGKNVKKLSFEAICDSLRAQEAQLVSISKVVATDSKFKQRLFSIQALLNRLEKDDTVVSFHEGRVLYDLKIAYYLMHPEGMVVDCENGFTTFFNTSFNTKFSFAEIAELYTKVIAPGAGNVCNIPIAEYSKRYVTNSSLASYAALDPKILLCGNNVPVSVSMPVPVTPCGDKLDSIAIAAADNKYQLYLESITDGFEVAYLNAALYADIKEKFTKQYDKTEHHFTLYYYDQAGNLVKTVPPAGIDDFRNYSGGRDRFVNDVDKIREDVIQNGVTINLIPDHTLVTQYRYNTLNQVVEQETPDAGVSQFWYDRLGRLVVSQNAKQRGDNTLCSSFDGNRYSYTLYDALGRITEVGQLRNSYPMSSNISRDPRLLLSWLEKTGRVFGNDNEGVPEQVTHTEYDLPYFQGSGTLSPYPLVQQNLRNRVSFSAVYATIDKVGEPKAGCQNSATYYSYDAHGNVDVLVQDFGSRKSQNCNNVTKTLMSSTGNRYKTIRYDYDLVSGKVNEVYYQPGKPDQFYHRYSYDAENRLTLVETSTDRHYWEKDANYEYYKHGPLARTLLGENQVQGIDYAYTLQGWLKGVNSTAVGDGEYDMGHDGKIGSPNSQVARDVFGFALNYYGNASEQDYTPINTKISNTPPFASVYPLLIGKQNNIGLTLPILSSDNINKPAETGQPLYNGNISSMLVNISQLKDPNLYGYEYDQLNRLVAMNTYQKMLTTKNEYDPYSINPTDDYKERIKYDPNGNILSYFRNGAESVNGLMMDDLRYKYNRDANGRLINNQLNHVNDKAVSSNYKEDIKDQAEGNYCYDPIGNLIKDEAEGIINIEWTVYGKISSINKKDGTIISYTYDASGNRISKKVAPANGTAPSETWYVRDAQGNVMSVYTNVAPPGVDAPVGDGFYQSEVHIYGSSRLGIYNVNRQLWGTVPAQAAKRPNQFPPIYTYIRGSKVYELTNHLGNVLVTISDRKDGVDIDGDGNIDYFTAQVVSANDYYPFGMVMPGRSFSSDTYRYGFNGMEKDNNIKGSGNDYTTLDRQYDPRLGKWLSIDPKADEYEDVSPYIGMDNNPISKNDIDGAGWGDRIMGTLIGTATNIIPGSTALRDMYHPSNANDYNDALKKTDEAALVLGGALMKGGTGATGAGVALAGAGLTVTAASGGTLAVGGVPAAAAGGALAETGVVTAAAGVTLTSNATNNQKSGYNHGAKKPAQSNSNAEEVNSKSQNKTASKKRTSTNGDKAMPSQKAARREAFRQHKVPTSKANNYKSAKDPSNKNFKILKTKDVHGNDVEIKHHPDGHEFKDNNTHEDPHYHGTAGNHITYPRH